MSILPVGIGPQEGGYQIERSLRFNSADSAYLNRTPASAGNQKTWTWSGWVKRSVFSTTQALFSQGTGTSANGYMFLRFDSDNLQISGSPDGGTFSILWTSAAVFRDPSAWYHVVATLDTTQATGSNRFKLYVNGVQQTGTFSTTPTQNADLQINRAAAHQIGVANAASLTNYLNGYLTEINFIDGSALDPTSFGEYNSDTGVWQPKAYTGSYGTNGFYLDFADNSSTTALGYDAAGSNDWTPNNFSVTAGAGNDSVVDTPTNNCATWNPLFFRRNGNKPAFSEGNKKVAGQSTQVSHTGSTIGSSGKHYAEFLVTDGTSGITGPGVVRNYWDDGMANSYASNYGGSYYADDGTRYYNGISDSQTAPGSNRVGIEVDFGGNEVSYYIVQSNGTRTLQGSKLTSSNGIDFKGSGIFTASLHDSSARTVTAFFNSDEWWGTPTSGYIELNTQNLPEPTIADGGQYFDTLVWSGVDGSDRTLSGLNFQPDFVWAKARTDAYSHVLWDAVRGAGSNKELYSDLTQSEGGTGSTATNGFISSFTSDGFATDNGSANTNLYFNASGKTYVAWNWKAGGTGVSNTDGSITSTVSANPTAGFSIVTYTGTGSAGTVGHGLGVAPSMIIAKRRDSGATPWVIYHISMGAANYMAFDTSAQSSTTAWNSTTPTSSVFSLGANVSVNNSTSPQLAYCFAPVAGYSAFGSYTGNGSSDGPFVYTGFRPAFVICKRTNTIGNWAILDTSRSAFNIVSDNLYANLSDAESSGGRLDILSNGFKLRTTGGDFNGSSGDTYIYMAFAESPFRYSLAR